MTLLLKDKFKFQLLFIRFKLLKIFYFTKIHVFSTTSTFKEKQSKTFSSKGNEDNII
jgi:hypothetical protein